MHTNTSKPDVATVSATAMQGNVIMGNPYGYAAVC